MASEIQGWQLDRIRAAAVEIADFFPKGHNDREIRAIAERALAGADEAVSMIPVESPNMQAGVRAQLEVERLRKIESAAREMFQVVEDEFPSIHVMRWRAALTNPAGGGSDE